MTPKPAPPTPTTPTASAPTTSTIASVDKALGILNLFNVQTAELGITEMAQMTGLHKSTLAGLVYTLERHGYLLQTPETRKYRLGLKLAERASVALQQYEVVAVAQKHMEQLLIRRGESVNFAVLEGLDVVYLAHLSGQHQLSVRVKIGKRASPHSTALGKAMLSVLPPLTRTSLLQALTLTALTPYTLTTVAHLSADLEACAARGYALDDQENELGGRCVAAPIFDWTAKVAGAVSLSAPLTRFPLEQVEDYSREIMATAQAISQSMGYRG